MVQEKKNGATAGLTDDVDLIRFDWAMKTILRNKANFDVLEGFLSALLREDVEVLELLESEGNQTTFISKYNRVDLLVKDSHNRKIIIEIQNNREADYFERVVYGASQKIVESVELDGSYKGISKVISISILYYNLGKGDDYIYYGTTEMKGLNTGTPWIVREKDIGLLKAETEPYVLIEKDIFPEYYFINIMKFNDVINKDADEWIYFFKNNKILDSFHSRNIQIAKKKFDLLKMSPKERKTYDNYLSDLMIENDVINTSKSDGIIIGLKQGREETKIETAINSIKLGLDSDIISKITGLTVEEIDKLR
ncbi:MAG: hypothetical protein B6226_04535 [Candidatus Cloacimonetes bacterium 4572_65]|nr:MAG: hypothetical protein B6226_04535 [Candidatus Cloacimonetes bacterium 4572_65]